MAEFRLPKNSRISRGKNFPAPEGAANTRKFRVYRWSPDDDMNPSIDTYHVDLDSGQLDQLLEHASYIPR